MKVSEDKTFNLSTKRFRIKSLFLDWLFICAYLLLLFIITTLFYFFVFNGIPNFTNMQSQLIATMTSVLPIILIFSMLEGRKNYASFGKRKSNLKVVYRDRPMIRSLIRNVLKFLPWQFGHMSTIYGIYNGFDTVFSIIFFTLSMILVVVYIVMVFIRKDKRHLADIIAGSRVVKSNSLTK